MAEQVVIEFAADTTKLQPAIDFLVKINQLSEKDAAAFKSAFEQTNAAIKQSTQQSISQVQKLSQEFKNLKGNAAAGVMLDQSRGVINTTKNIISLREQIKQATAKTIEFAAKFGELDSRTIAAAKNAAILKERFSDAQKTIAALNPEAKFTAFTQLGSVMAGAFQVATGALQTFGVESETATKLAQQFQGALNIASGLNQLTNLKDAISNVKAALGITTVAATSLAESTVSIAESTKDYNAGLSALKNTNDTYKLALDKIRAAKESLIVVNAAEATSAEGAAVATKSFTSALLTNPVFIAIAAVTALASAYVFLKEDINDTSEELKRNAEIRGEVLRSTEKERIQIGLLIEEYRNNTTEQGRRLDIEQQLIEKAPEFFSKLDEELSKTDALTNAYRLFIEVSQKRAEAQILIGKIAELNAQRAVDEANGIEDNVKGVNKFTVALLNVLNPGAAAAVKIKAGTDGLAESVANNTKEAEAYTKVLNNLIKELESLGFGLDATKKQGDEKASALKKNAEKENSLNAERLKEKRDLEYKLREIGISLIADEFEQRRQRLALEFDKEIDLYADKLQQKKITLEEFNKIFQALSKKNAEDTAEITRQGNIKAFADEESLRKQQTDNIIKIIQDQNTVLQTEDIEALNDRIKAKQEALRASGLDEVTIARQIGEFINEETRKLNEKRLNDEIATIEDKLKIQTLSASEQIALENELQNKKKELVEAGNKAVLDNDEKTAAKRKQLQEDIFQGLQVGLQIYGTISELSKSFADEQISDIERVRDAELDAIDKRFAKNEEDKKNRTISERKFRDVEKALLKEKTRAEKEAQDKINEIKRKQDLANRTEKLFEIAIATARNIVEAGNPVIAALYAVLGAAQTAVVLATPLPKYFKGTPSLQDNRYPMGRDTIPVMANRGEAIIPTNTTEEYRQAINAIYYRRVPADYMNRLASGYGKHGSPTVNVSGMNIDYDKLGQSLAWHIRGLREVKIKNVKDFEGLFNYNYDPRRA